MELMGSSSDHSNQPRHISSSETLKLQYVRGAVDEALRHYNGDPFDAAERAVSAMPADASDFDCGLAAGFILGKLLPSPT
jgi:hypothetical protein